MVELARADIGKGGGDGWFGAAPEPVRKVTTCARLQMPSGAKWVSSMPEVMPLFTAQITGAK